MDLVATVRKSASGTAFVSEESCGSNSLVAKVRVTLIVIILGSFSICAVAFFKISKALVTSAKYMVPWLVRVTPLLSLALI